jgi:hypothetical protein
MGSRLMLSNAQKSAGTDYLLSLSMEKSAAVAVIEVLAVNDASGLTPVIRLFDLLAPNQSLDSRCSVG